MPICAKISVFFVILFPNQLTKSRDTTMNMFSSKGVYQPTTEENVAEDHSQSDTLADSAANISLRRQIWQYIKEEYMKESNTRADNVANISLRREI